MKNIFSTLTLLGFLLLFCGSSCKKHKHVKPINQLPPVTQEGKNTLGCYINGKPFIPFSTLFGLVHPLSTSYYSDPTLWYKAGSLFIDGLDKSYRADTSGVEGSASIHKMNVFDTGEYPLKYISDCDTCNASFYHNQDEGFYSDRTEGNYFADTGELHITKLDTLNQIISGTFWFDAIDTVTGKKVEIREGRFDLLYTRSIIYHH